MSEAAQKELESDLIFQHQPVLNVTFKVKRAYHR